jgi:hypothetical protein
MTWAERKREELLAKLRGIEWELAFWQTQAEDGGPLEKHQSQIDRLVNQLQPVAALVRGEIRTADLRGDWPTFETQVLDLHRIWQFFREKLALRFVDHFRDYLLAADEFAWACYRPAQENLVAAGTLDRSEVKEPPLVCFSSVASPFTIPRGASYRGELEGGSPRDRTTRAIVESLPIPVVAVPWYQIQHLPDALVLGHEVGHVVERDARVEGYVHQLILDAVRGTAERYGTEDDWQRWSSEAFADIYGALCGGPAFVSALSDFLLVPAGRPAGGAGEYPPANVRLALVVAALRATEVGIPEGSAEGREVLRAIEERWLHEGVEVHQPNEVPAVATAIVHSRYRQFNDLRLADVVTFNGKQMRTTARALLDGDPIGTRDVRTLMAAAAWAYADEPEKYHTVNVPGRVLQRVMAIVEPGARETRVMRTEERAEADAVAACKLHKLLVQGSLA